MVGWLFALSSVIFIPVVAIYQILIERGSLLTVSNGMNENIDDDDHRCNFE